MNNFFTVFTVADERYEPFVLPYAVSTLINNPDAFIEVIVGEPQSFERNNAHALELIASFFPERIMLQRGNFDKYFNPHAMRFLTQPSNFSDYVYIGDIDILNLEEIRSAHLDSMSKTELPYSNIIRPGQMRMGGLHFTSWDAFYPQPPISDINLLSKAEHLLYALVKEKAGVLPREDHDFRPLHGYHLTLSRPPHCVKGFWDGTRNPEMFEKYLKIRENEVWSKALPLFDLRYRKLITILEAGLAVLHPKVRLHPLPGTHPRDWW